MSEKTEKSRSVGVSPAASPATPPEPRPDSVPENASGKVFISRSETSNETPRRLSPFEEDKRTFFSSWMVSLLFHAVLFVILMFTITTAAPKNKGITEEETANVGIAFKTLTDEKTLYESAEEAMSEDASEADGEENSAEDSSLKTDAETIAALSSAISDTERPNIPDVASRAPGLAPSQGDGSSGISSISDGLGDVPGVGPGTFKGFGKGKISCFGTSGEGNTFIFVFDRSASMGFHPSGTTKTPMTAAKTELRRSLRMLQSNQQFQILFYNGLEEDLLQFEANRMLFATKENVVSAERFLTDIAPDGGTDHKTALSHGLRQHPDVLFFLTDADENETSLTASDLERIRKNAAGTQINAIQFGSGPKPAASNWLALLAQQNGGQYVYIDVSQL